MGNLANVDLDDMDYEMMEDYEKSIERDMCRFLTFKSDDLIFGAEASYVVEIITNYMVRSMPLVPDFVKGVINLRGQVLPIIDLRERMGKAPQEYTDTTCTIILDVEGNMFGITVDEVLQVLDIKMSSRKDIPTEDSSGLAEGMLTLEDQTVVFLLDCSKVLLMDNIE